MGLLLAGTRRQRPARHQRLGRAYYGAFLEPAVTDHLSSATAQARHSRCSTATTQASVFNRRDRRHHRRVEFAGCPLEPRQLVSSSARGFLGEQHIPTAHPTQPLRVPLLMLSSTKCSLTMRSSQRLHQRSPQQRSIPAELSGSSNGSTSPAKSSRWFINDAPFPLPSLPSGSSRAGCDAHRSRHQHRCNRVDVYRFPHLESAWPATASDPLNPYYRHPRHHSGLIIASLTPWPSTRLEHVRCRLRHADCRDGCGRASATSQRLAGYCQSCSPTRCSTARSL